MNIKWFNIFGVVLVAVGISILFYPQIILYLGGLAVIITGLGVLYLTRLFNRNKNLSSLTFQPFFIIQEKGMEEEDEENEWPPHDLDSLH